MLKHLVAAALLTAGVLTLPAHRGEFVPPAAQQYRARLTREARAAGGLSAPVSMFAAQLHAESGWRTGAQSGVGAVGIAQFMPGTSAWIANLYPADLKPAAPYDAGWAIRALVTYDYWIYKRVPMFKDGDDRWAAALASYNGGLGNVFKEVKIARTDTACSTHCGALLEWWNCVARFNSRSQAAWTESRNYPERILHALRPLYLGWN